MKIYIITYEDCSSCEYSFEVLNSYTSLELAQARLQELKQDDLENYFNNGYGDYDSIEELEASIVKESPNEILFSFFDDYTKYSIVESILEGVKIDENFVSLDDVKLYNSIIEEGIETYTSQDGRYAEYDYEGDKYILKIDHGYLTIEIKEED